MNVFHPKRGIKNQGGNFPQQDDCLPKVNLSDHLGAPGFSVPRAKSSQRSWVRSAAGPGRWYRANFNSPNPKVLNDGKIR